MYDHLNTRYNEVLTSVKLQGMNASKKYRVTEINLLPGTKSTSPHHNKIYKGDYLMKVGLNLSTAKVQPLTSAVFELREADTMF